MKKIVIILMCIFYAFGIEIQITPDKNITINHDDVKAMKSYLLQTIKFHIKEKGAYNLVRDNRILANSFLKKYRLDSYNKSYIKIVVERYLADLFVKKTQERMKLDEKILLSYYLDNKEQFKKEDQVDIVLFIFKDPIKALKFFNEGKEKDFLYLKKLAKKYKIIMADSGYKPVDEIKYPTRAFIEKYKKGNVLLPPIIYGPDSADVIYIKEYKEGKGYLEFEKVKDKIKKILLRETFNRERIKLLKEYGIK